MQKQSQRKKSKIYCSVLLSFILVICSVIPVFAQDIAELYQPDFDVQAQAVYLVNGDSGMVIYEKNAEEQLIPASLVKMMTCLVVMDNVQDLDAETVTAQQWVFDEIYGKQASNADIWQGETLTVRELLYAMIMPSANEAALMLAGYVSGDYMPNFLYMMNSKAEALGCTGTSFADPNGLSTENVTTARDMYLIVKAFMENPTLAEIAGSNSFEMPAHNHTAPYYIATTNRFLVSTDPYAKAFPDIASSVQGGKTGSLGEWQNFASKAEKNGETYYCVVLNSPNSADAIAAASGSTQVRPALYETGELYTWVYNNFSTRATLDASKPITEIRVKYSSDQNTVRLMPENAMKTVLPNSMDDSKIERSFDLPEYLSAPLKKGDVVGTITLSYEGQTIGTVNLLVSEDIHRNWVLFGAQKFEEFSSTGYFKLLIVLIVIAVVVYLVLRNNKRKKQREKQRLEKMERAQRVARQKQQEIDNFRNFNQRPPGE